MTPVEGLFGSGRSLRITVLALLMAMSGDAAWAQPSAAPDRAYVACKSTRSAATTLLICAAPQPAAAVTAQQSTAPGRANTACKSARKAVTRLICADPELATVDSILTIALQDALKAKSPAERKPLTSGQLAWLKERDQKCGLTGKDGSQLSELRPATQCLEDAIGARIAELQGDYQTGSNSPFPPAPYGQNLITNPDAPPSVLTDAHAPDSHAAEAPEEAAADTVPVQQSPAPSATNPACKSTKSAATRLICADPDLAALNLILTVTLQDARGAAAADQQKLLTKQQSSWLKERDQKCGLTGKDRLQLSDLRPATQCLKDAIETRTSQLKGDDQAGSIAASPPTPPGADSALQTTASIRVNPACKSAKGAATGLICADPDLAAIDSILAVALQDARNVASPEQQKLLTKQQVSWLKERDQKCGLTGKDHSKLSDLRPATQCLKDAIEARTSQLKGDDQTGSIAASPPATPAGADSAQQATASIRANQACKSAKSAARRMICADPDLATIDSTLTASLQEARKAASPDQQKLLTKQQFSWLKERNQKCGLTGKDPSPLSELQSATQCLQDAIKARISELQGDDQTNSIAPTPPAPSGQNLIITPIAQPPVSLGSRAAEPAQYPPFEKLHFSAPTEGINGIIDCSAPPSQQLSNSLSNTPLSGKWIVRIAIDDDENSYRMYESDTWTPFLDNLRNAAHASCAGASKSGRLRNAANEPVTELNDVFEVYSPRSLFLAYSTKQDNPWTLQSNLPKARKLVKSDLGIQDWIYPSQLTRNPYYFKDAVVGMVVQFDHMLSENEAVFERSGDQIFVSGVSSNLFQNKELIVLSGRVTGNKGLISPMGSEVLLPALDYVGSYKCGDQCGGF